MFPFYELIYNQEACYFDGVLWFERQGQISRLLFSYLPT